MAQLPDRAEIDATCKVIDDHAQSIYTWQYERTRPQLVTLYNKAAQSQWVSVTDLDWSTDVDPESLVDLDAPEPPADARGHQDARVDRSPPGEMPNWCSWASRCSRRCSASSCTASRAP